MAASSALKFMTLFCEVRPIHWARASFFPSTITSNTLPKLDAFLRIWISRCFPCRAASRRTFSASGIGSSSLSAGVLDFIEQRKGFLELCLRLAGKADDDVSCDADFALRSFHP